MYTIEGSGRMSALELASFLLFYNKEIDAAYALSLSEIYIEEAVTEGINWDVAFVQMCLETGFLKFGGLVKEGQNNFCGLGSYNNREGAVFSSKTVGVRAHIQHLKAYANREPLVLKKVDPRFHYVKRGSAPYVADLAGRWAEDRAYGTKLKGLLVRLHSFRPANELVTLLEEQSIKNN